MIDNLLKEITEHGDRGAIVPISRFDELKCELEELKTGKYHMFSDWILNSMNITNDIGFTPRSLITVIVPSPKVMIGFTYNGKVVHYIIPPQYLDEVYKDEEVLQYINAYLKPHGYKAALFDNLPQKLLAVHSGIGLYGRNNLCFHKEFGSYIRILSFISDLPCEESAWYPARRMDTCDNCSACINVCPTNAIEPNYRIINTSNCLTFMNEVPEDFPEWVYKNAHNALIGCIK